MEALTRRKESALPSGIPRIPEPREWLLKKCCTGCGETKPWAKFSPLRKWPDGSVKSVRSRCHTCAAKDGWESEKRNGVRESSRQYRVEWKRRRRAELKDEAKGFGAHLPLGPFREWLLVRYDAELGQLVQLATSSGIDHSTLLKAMRNTTKTRISFTTVDAVLTAVGEHPRDLYPDWYEETAA